MEDALTFNTDSIETLLLGQGLEWGINIAAAIAILFIGKWVAKRLVKVAERVMHKSKMDETLITFLSNVLFGLAFAFVIIAAISQLGVETASLAAVIAAAGLAIGLSLQNSLSNLAAGVMIIAFRPFRKNDFIEAAGVSGNVDAVTIFTTHLRTPDNKAVIIPNGAILAGNIINYSAKPMRRIDLIIGVSYQDDLKYVKDVLEDILRNETRILKDPKPDIAVGDLGDSAVLMHVQPWVISADYHAVRSAIIEKVKLRFDEEGISIPYPQRDVYMHPVSKKSGL